MRFTEVMFTECSDLGEDEITRSVVIYEEVSDLTIDEFCFAFIKPLLRGVGYSDKLIDEYVGG